MYRIRWTAGSAALLTGMIFCCSSVLALDIEPGVGVGLQYTDNAALTADDEDSDWIATGSE